MSVCSPFVSVSVSLSLCLCRSYSLCLFPFLYLPVSPLNLSPSYTHSQEKDRLSRCTLHPAAFTPQFHKSLPCVHTASHFITHALPPCHSRHLIVIPSQTPLLSTDSHAQFLTQRYTVSRFVTRCDHTVSRTTCSQHTISHSATVTWSLKMPHSPCVSEGATSPSMTLRPTS